MTFWDMLRSWARRWPIVLAGAFLTAAAGLLALNDDGVYYTRTEIVFMAPTSTAYPNSLQTKSEDIIITAGLVAKRVLGPDQQPKYAAPEVTLVGVGVRDGWSLRLPDSGGQWATNFTEQLLLLEIVGPDEQTVQERQTELVSRIQDELYDMQREQGVDPINDITATAAPQSTVIYHVTGSTPRVLAMTGFLGGAATLAIVVLIDTRDRRRMPRGAEPSAQSAPATEPPAPEPDRSADALHEARR